MSHAPKIVTIFGGSGFVGRYVARRMARDGWRVRVAVRRPNEATYVRTYGGVGQVEPILANIRDDASTRAAIAGADAVINCVGLLQESGAQKFDAVHIAGAARIAQAAADAGVEALVHISALGADADSECNYLRSKAEGDDAVLAAYPKATILRPSAIFGTEDTFLNFIAKFAKMSPVLPLVGANSKLQPVFVDDVAQAAVNAIAEQRSGIFELGGPNVETVRELVQRTIDVVRRRRLLIAAPFWVATAKAWAFDIGQAMTGGLIVNKILTRDQVRLLRNDLVVADGAKTLADLGVQATSMDAKIEGYLYCHRASGQYTAIKESAANLKS